MSEDSLLLKKIQVLENRHKRISQSLMLEKDEGNICKKLSLVTSLNKEKVKYTKQLGAYHECA